MSETDPRQYRPHVPRNRDPILDVLRRVLPQRGLVLEIASGSGEHAAYFAQALPSLTWQPSDPDQTALASAAAHRDDMGLPNLLAPLRLDVTAPSWPIERADAIICCNMIHIAPWVACEGLIAGAARVLGEGGILYLYGPYKIGGVHTAPSNQEFDGYLRSQNPTWGIRDLDEVAALAGRHNIKLIETVAMPANNLSVIFSR
jgi:SAM-dependent methyltransferase